MVSVLSILDHIVFHIMHNYIFVFIFQHNLTLLSYRISGFIIVIWFSLSVLNQFYLFPQHNGWMPTVCHSSHPPKQSSTKLAPLNQCHRQPVLSLSRGTEPLPCHVTGSCPLAICLNSAFSVWKAITLASITRVESGKKMFLNRIPICQSFNTDERGSNWCHLMPKKVGGLLVREVLSNST